MFVITTRSFPPDIGGMQSLMEGLSKSLAEHGPVKIFAEQHQNSQVYDKNSQLNITRISGIKLFRKYRKANIVSDFVKENKNIRALFTDHWKSLEHLNHEIIKKIPTFCLIHSKEINHSPGSRLNSRLIRSLNKANYIIANSNFTKNLAIKSGVSENLIKVIFPGVNEPIEIDKESDLQAKKIFGDSFPKLITVARLDIRKGHDKVIMALKNLKLIFPKMKYLCIGYGEEETKLKKLVNEMHLENDVIFLKNIEPKLKFALIQNANLSIMPSRIVKRSVEGFGISFIEAATYNIASIGGKDGGAADAIIHNKTGLICDGEDLNSIYDSVLKFFKKNNYKEYGKAANEFSKNFYWKKIIKQYIELIN